MPLKYDLSALRRQNGRVFRIEGRSENSSTATFNMRCLQPYPARGGNLNSCQVRPALVGSWTRGDFAGYTYIVCLLFGDIRQHPPSSVFRR